MKHVVAYDITADARRARVAAILQSIGDRIQYSLFLCDVEGDLLAEAVERCRQSMDPATDSLYVFQQCQSCWDVVGTHGQAHPHEPVYYWAVW